MEQGAGLLVWVVVSAALFILSSVAWAWSEMKVAEFKIKMRQAEFRQKELEAKYRIGILEEKPNEGS